MSILPYFFKAVVAGSCDRAGKPTMQIVTCAKDSLVDLNESLSCGIYCGWVQIEESSVCKMIANVRMIPKEKREIDLYILHKFKPKLNGKNMKIILIERMRGYHSLCNAVIQEETLIADIKYGETVLEMSKYQLFKKHTFFAEECNLEPYMHYNVC